MLEAKTNPIISVVNNIKCLLELGEWSPETLNKLLTEAHTVYLDSSSRMHFIARNFIGVKFAFESMSPVLPKGMMRVRLEYMDCVTYIYNLLALCKSKNFFEFVNTLYKIRYAQTEANKIDNNSDTGNIFDFVSESLLINAAKLGFVKDITEEVVNPVSVVSVSVELKRFQRPNLTDKYNLYVTPRYGERIITENFIDVHALHAVDTKKIKSGDIILFTNGPYTKSNTPSPVLISHLAIAFVENNEIYFYHATRHFYWKPYANKSTKPSYTGIFLDQDNKKEIIGTGIGGVFAGEETRTEKDGQVYFGLNQAIKRPLKDFAVSIFKGVKFLRIL